MTFIELLQSLEQQLGNHHLPLNPHAATYKQIFEGVPVHHDVMRELVGAIYTANSCRQLTDMVDKGKTFAAVGPLRRDALKRPTADVDVYRLLDDFCHALDNSFTEEGSIKTTAEKKSAEAEIIRLDAVRRRK